MKTFNVLRSFIRRLWQMNRRFVLVVVAEKLLIALRTLLVIFIPKLLLDLLTQEASPASVGWTIGIIGALTLVTYLLESAATRTVNIEKERVALQFEQIFSEKLMRLPYRHLEDPFYLEMKEEAKTGFMIGSVEDLLYHISVLLEKTIVLIGLTAMLLTLNPFIFAVMCLLQVVVGYLLYRRSMLFRDTLQAIIPINRKFNYFIEAMLDARVQKDIRLYDMSDMLTENVYHYNELVIRNFIALDWKSAIYTCFNNLISYFIAVMVFFYAGLRVLAGTMKLGNFSLYAGAAINFSSTIFEGLSEAVSIINKTHFLGPIETFLELPDEAMNEGKPFDEPLESIELRNVSFRYPKTETWILEDISFTIKRGEKISIVGLNGAGKSTLVKLICRFFVPDNGTILVNGRDIQEYEAAGYMKQISAVFQDFQLLNFSIAENILAEQHASDTARKTALDWLTDLDMAEKIKNLPHGLDTYLGKHYHEDGIEFSGGELQKLAIARALNKNAQLIILDEPTSALDPIAEAEIYEHFNQLIGNKTAIYISHRMSSSIFCDRIVLIDNGRLQAIDTHHALMQDTSSLYYKLFQIQAAHYQM